MTLNSLVGGYPHLVMDDYGDIEAWLLSPWGVASALEQLRPLFPRWRRQLRENGVERVSIDNALASNLMVAFIRDAMPETARDRHAMHEHRNLLWAQGAPMLRDRGWKD